MRRAYYRKTNGRYVKVDFDPKNDYQDGRRSMLPRIRWLQAELNELRETADKTRIEMFWLILTSGIWIGILSLLLLQSICG